MDVIYSNTKETKTTKMFNKLNVLWYLASLPDFWIAEVNLPKTFQKIYNSYQRVLHYVLIGFALVNIGAFLTQHDSEPQQELKIVSALSSCIILFYRLVLCHYRTEVRKILFNLTVVLKEYNNEEVEQKMLSKIKLYTYMFFCTSITSIVIRGIKGALQVYRGGFFVTFVTMWPDVKDPSLTAEIVRYVIYILWYMCLLQSFGTFMMIIAIMIAISHQYENLTRYFYDLNEIFKDKRKSQATKEKEYEEGLLKGLYWHVITLWCVKQCQYTCRIIFNIMLTFGPLLLIFILPEMMNQEVNTKVKLARVPVLLSILIYLGFFMWNAGDITVEAYKLPEGLYGSGWHNCYGRTGVRLRKLIVIAMQQAQQPAVLTAFGTITLSYESYIAQPAVLTAFGTITLSYESYIAIIKTSYSFFSVLAA